MATPLKRLQPLLQAAVIGIDVVDVEVRRRGGRLARRGHGVKGDFGFAGEGGDRLPAVADEMISPVTTPASAAPIEALWA